MTTASLRAPAYALRNTTAITYACYASMLFLGVGFAIIGAAASTIGLSAAQIGTLIAVQQAGFAVAIFASGFLGEVIGRPRVILCGCIVIAASFLGFYRTPSLLINALMMFGVGLGMGAFEGSTDALLLEMHQKNQTRYININHFFVTIGAMAITFYLSRLDALDWRSSVTQTGLVALAIGVVFAFAHVHKTADDGGGRPLGGIKIQNKRLVVLLFLFGVLSVGIELGAYGFLPAFLVDHRAFAAATAKLVLLLFFAGVAAGRLAIGLFAANRWLRLYLLAFLASATIAFTTLFFVPTAHALTAVLVFVAGVTISAPFPLMIAFAGLTWKEHAGPVISVLKLSIPAGGMLLPFAVGAAARERGLLLGLAVLPIAALAATLIAVICKPQQSGVSRASG